MTVGTLALVLAITAWAAPAFAARGACGKDAATFCPGSQPGGGRIMKCPRTHQGDLSEECKRELAARHGRR